MSLGKKSEHGIVEKNIVLGKMFNYCTWGKKFQLGAGGEVSIWHWGKSLNVALRNNIEYDTMEKSQYGY